jgi:membrane protease YdiL (CAAX protease family)
MKDLTAIILNRHRELRSGWRMLLFLLLSGGVGVAILFPLQGFLEGRELLAIFCVLAAVLLATYLMTRFANKKPLTAVGLSLHPGTFRELGTGCLLGFLMMTGIFFVEYGMGYVSFHSRGLSVADAAWLVLQSVTFFAVSAFFEELLFRGYLFQTLIQAVTFLPALLIVAVLFALAHAGNPNAGTLSLVNVALAGIWLSFAYMKTRSLWLPIGLHASWNFSQTTLFSFPTSGVQFAEKHLYALNQTGPDWVTGGAFGPEGGALCTVALLICTSYILKSDVCRAPEGIITLDSVEDLLKPTQGSGGQSA